MKLALGIDTSMYTTSCALADNSGRIIHTVSRPLPVAQGSRGLRQNDAVFLHVRQLPQVLSETLAATDGQVEAICVSAKPVDAADSYMPVFLAGLSLAKSLSLAWKVPVVETTHQRGHLRAAMINNPQLPSRFLAVHCSGGTTDVLLCEPDSSICPLAAGLDLHAGQLVDRAGVAMGLPFPAGLQMDKLALLSKAGGRYPVSIRDTGFHLSGAENAALRDIQGGVLPREDIAANVLDVVMRSLLRALARAQEKTQVCDVLLFGGVMASSWLRAHMPRRVEQRRLGLMLHFGLPEYAGDNAAGVALLAFEQENERAG